MTDEVFTVKEIQDIAFTRLTKLHRDFIELGAQDEQTKKENMDAIKRIKLRPRVMRNVLNRDMKTSFLGYNIAMPIALSPSAIHIISHPCGEKASSNGALEMNTFMLLSYWSSFTASEVITANPGVIIFQQIQMSTPKQLTKYVIKQAIAAGVKGFALTVDSARPGNHLRRSRNKTDLNYFEPMSNFYIRKLMKEFGNDLHNHFCDESNTWDDLTWVKSQTGLPVIVKGITHPEDAKLAIQYGADAILVSNHGGRQLDCMPAAIDVLPEIVKAVDGKVEVIVDGGFRTGIDVYKALALGAKVVLIGRPVLYGLAYGGANGVKRVLEILKKELDNTMALMGCKTLKDIDENCLLRKPCVSCKL